MKTEILPELSVRSGQARIPLQVAIERHIAQFWDERHHSDSDLRYGQDELIERCVRIPGIPEKKTLKDLHIDELNLVYQLIEHDNNAAAIELAQNPTHMRLAWYPHRPIRELLLKTTTLTRSEIKHERNLVESIALDKLEATIRGKKRWKLQWEMELRTLTPHYLSLYEGKKMLSRWSMQVGKRKTIEWNA